MLQRGGINWDTWRKREDNIKMVLREICEGVDVIR